MTDSGKFVLGTSYMSKALVDNHKAPATAISAGLICGLGVGGVLTLGGNPEGVSGMVEPSGQQSLTRTGLKVCVRLAASQSPVIGSTVYVTSASGLAGTASGTGIVATTAVFASEKIIGIDPDTKGEFDAALIDFTGAL